MQKFSTIAKGFRTAVTKHSPEILTGLGIAGMVTTTVLAVKATPKACKLIEAKKKEERIEDLTIVDTVKTTWKCYIPAVITGTTSIACLIGANSVNAKRNAALATAYKLSETALVEYRDKVIETIGEKKEQTVREKVAEERIKKNPISNNEVIVTGTGSTLCLDVLSGRYFTSDMETLKRTENYLNKRMLSENYISLNEFYSELGLSNTQIGDQIGWNVDRGMIDLEFSSQIAEDGRPCLVVDYLVAPRYDFSSFF